MPGTLIFLLFIIYTQNAISPIPTIKDFVEFSHLTYQKLDELKVVPQPVKIICILDPFKPKIEGCELGEREWSRDKKKGEQVWGKIESA